MRREVFTLNGTIGKPRGISIGEASHKLRKELEENLSKLKYLTVRGSNQDQFRDGEWQDECRSGHQLTDGLKPIGLNFLFFFVTVLTACGQIHVHLPHGTVRHELHMHRRLVSIRYS